MQLFPDAGGKSYIWLVMIRSATPYLNMAPTIRPTNLAKIVPFYHK